MGRVKRSKSERRVGSAFVVPDVPIKDVQAVVAVDPGMQHCGLCELRRDPEVGGWRSLGTWDLSPIDCLEHVREFLLGWSGELSVGGAVLVVEGFQLFPSRMAEQGLSRMGTPELIGALKWLYLDTCWLRRVPNGVKVGFAEQGASVKAAGCRVLSAIRGGACAHVTNDRGKREWKHDPSNHEGSNVHKRDAESHAWYRVKKLGLLELD